jgi:hypothetical protein
VDPQLGHEVQDLDLRCDGRILDGRGLEPVAERLVVELDGLEGSVVEGIARGVAVVDQVLLAHWTSRLRKGSAFRMMPRKR